MSGRRVMCSCGRDDVELGCDLCRFCRDDYEREQREREERLTEEDAYFYGI